MESTSWRPRSWWCSFHPNARRLETLEEPVFQCETKWRKQLISHYKGSQAGGAPSWLSKGQSFSSIQVLNWLGEVYPCWGGQSALLSLPISMFISSSQRHPAQRLTKYLGDQVSWHTKLAITSFKNLLWLLLSCSHSLWSSLLACSAEASCQVVGCPIESTA